jgi:hypothetical protein
MPWVNSLYMTIEIKLIIHLYYKVTDFQLFKNYLFEINSEKSELKVLILIL